MDDLHREALLDSLKKEFERIDAQRQVDAKRYREGFDGLLARIPDGASPLLISIISELERFLMRKYRDETVKGLLASVSKGLHADPELMRIPEADLLALSLLAKIQIAFGKENESFLFSLLGPSGFKEERRRVASQQPRRPQLDAWIKKQLIVDSTLRSSELWERASSRHKEGIGQGRFAKRVTAVRKALKSDASK